MAGVYLISNTLNDKVYVGSTSRLGNRFQGHLHALALGNARPVFLV